MNNGHIQTILLVIMAGLVIAYVFAVLVPASASDDAPVKIPVEKTSEPLILTTVPTPATEE